MPVPPTSARLRGPLLAVAVLVCAACVLRFVALEHSPPGFYVDEAAIAAQVICLRQSGHDLHGVHLPIFSEVLGGGFASPVLLYPASAWTALAGDSIAAFRAFSALFGVLFVAASFLFGLRAWRDIEAAWLCALCAALSPWAFQFSRIAWDPALAPALAALAFALLLAQGRFALVEAVLGGLLAAAAAYAYPPLRAQLALALPAIALFALWRSARRGECLRNVAAYAITCAIAALPLLQLTLRGDVQARFRFLSVFNPDHLAKFGEQGFMAGMSHFLANLVRHFDAGFLFVSGDANLRHSIQSVGLWSWLDALGVALLLVASAHALRTRRPGLAAPALLAACGYLAGVVPAALTWEGVPHALRSIGAVVFLALGAGGGLAFAWRRGRAWQLAILAVALAFAVHSFAAYFGDYPSRARPWFDADVRDALYGPAAAIAPGADERVPVDYPTPALRYYELVRGSHVCRPP